MRRSLITLISLIALSSCGPGDSVELRTVDGLGLRAYEIGGGDEFVILAHDPRENPGAIYEFARQLGDRGYKVLTFQYRGRGGSQGEADPSLAPRDIEAAIHHAKRNDARGVALIGFSTGGAAALAAAAEAPVDAIAVVSAPVAYGLSTGSAMLKLDASKIFIASLKDEERAKAAGELLRLSKDPLAQIRILTVEGRGTDMLLGRRGKEAIGVLEEFLAEEL